MTNEGPIDWNSWKTSGAIYGTSDQQMLFWGASSTSNVPKQYPSIYSNDFFLENSKPWTTYAGVHTKLAIPLEAKIPPRLDWDEPEQKRFEKDFLWAQEKLQSKEFSKVVLTTETRAPKKVPPDIFLENALGKIPQHTHLYGQWSENKGFIGYTPEILFSIEDNNFLSTMALAGTSAIDSMDSDLFIDKNKSEHESVVEDIVNTLTPFGRVKRSAVKPLKLDTLAHLQTSISLDLTHPQSASDWIHTVHPTPALGVAPRSEWKQLKPLRQGYGSFGAPFAYAGGEHQVTAVVGIRQLAWDEKHYYIRCGCGVVTDSQCSSEWDELLLKIKSVKKRFGWNR